MNITDMQVLMNKTNCPQCNNTHFDVALRCDLGLDACLAVATCQVCDTQYEVRAKRRSHEKDVMLEFRCDLPTHQCFYTVPDHQKSELQGHAH